MSLHLTPEEVLIQQTAREFADKELAPIASKIDQQGEMPRAVLDKMASLGFLGMLTPEKYGGVGLTNLALALVQLEINRACASTGVTMSVHNSLCQSPILKFGTDEQKDKYLPRLTKGEWIGAYSLTEPVSGTDAAALITTATREGGDFVIPARRTSSPTAVSPTCSSSSRGRTPGRRRSRRGSPRSSSSGPGRG